MRFEVKNSTHFCQHGGVDTVSLCQSSGCFSKPACLPRIDLGECCVTGDKRRLKTTMICTSCLEYDQWHILSSYPADKGLVAGFVIRYLGVLVVRQPPGVQSVFRNIDANCSPHLSFPCLVLSCELGARVSVQAERKDEGDHTHLRSMMTKTEPIRPPPLPGISGVPDSASSIAWEPVLHKTRQKHSLIKLP